MTKTKTISMRISSETEQKLNWLIKETNSGDISYKPETMSDIIERCIHNEWVSINMANLAWRDEEIMVDDKYIEMIEKRVKI